MEKEKNLFPNQSILLKPEKKSKKNFFYSEIFEKEIKPIYKENEKEDNKLIQGLQDILKCCICLKYLDNPVNDPICSHYACKKCLEDYFISKKSDEVPCPLCRKKIKKSNLVQIPLVKSIKEILKESKNKDYSNNIIHKDFEIEKCEKHPKNKVFFFCLDCRVKMCPICDKEKQKHESKNHHICNYERYLKLFYIFQNNFKSIKQTILGKEKNINECRNLVSLLEQQKIAYMNLFTNIYKQIKMLYNKSQENINKIIAQSMQTIARLKNFMVNIKSHISEQFKEKYNEIDNLDDIEKEIKKRINELKLKEIKIEDITDIKNKYIKTITSSLKHQSFGINKNELLKHPSVSCKIEEDGIYSFFRFGLSLNKNKKDVIIYLDINKIINNKSNDSSYIVCIEYGKDKKRLYLELYQDDKYYSFENSLTLDEIFEDKQNLVEIKLIILNLSIN